MAVAELEELGDAESTALTYMLNALGKVSPRRRELVMTYLLKIYAEKPAFIDVIGKSANLVGIPTPETTGD